MKKLSVTQGRTHATALLLVLLVTAACAGGQDKKLILSANDLQDAAARAYVEASALESAAGAACAEKARVARITLPPPTPENVAASRKTCSDLGAPIPFDPFKLASYAGPVNATYEAIRAADAIRRGAKPGNLGASIGAVLEAISRLYAAGKDIGISLPQDKAAALVGGAR